MKTIRFTKLQDGYWLATAGLRNAIGGYDTWAEFASFCKSEVGIADNLFVWFVQNGVAHVLSVKAESLI